MRLMALLILLSACSKTEAIEEIPKIPVSVEELKPESAKEIVVYTADLKPSTEIMVYSPVSDRVLEFSVQDGDPVKTGQRIALIKREGLDRGLEQIHAQIEALDAQIAQQTTDLARYEELLTKGVLTQQAYDQAKTALSANKAQRKALEASWEQLAVNAGNARIEAPINGILANKNVSVGDLVSPQRALCSIMSIDKLKVELKLREEDVGRVKLGQTVDFHFDSLSTEVIQGKITRISPYLELSNRTSEVEVSIDNPLLEDGLRKLKPGMFGKAEITVENHENVILAPESSLMLDPELIAQGSKHELRRSFIIKDGKAYERTVTLGARIGDKRLLLDGINAGEKLVTKGQHLLHENDQVEVIGEI